MSAATFLFADLAGFTALTEAHGDEDAADLAESFTAQVCELLPDGDAQLVKTIGDAVMLRLGEAGFAVELGVRIAGDLLGDHGAPAVRVGMDTGPAAERAGDWFGATVNVAARVAGVAAGGEVLVTDRTVAAAGPDPPVRFVDRGMHELRNVGERLHLHRAVRQGRSVRLPVDPVCRMTVQRARAAGVLRHADREYLFCSLDCAGRFAAAPERFVRG